MHSVILSPYIGIATINVMHRSMPGVLLTRAISLRSRMRGKLSCPVLKAGRRERSLLPSYQNGLHYVRDVSFGEDRSRLRSGSAPQLMAALRNLAITLIHRNGSSQIAASRRHFASHPREAFSLLLPQRRSPQQIAIGRASRPFPRSKPSRHLSMHSAFQLHLCTSRQWVSGISHSRTHQHLWAPSSAFPSSPFLSDVRQVSPGRPSPCLRHYNRAFGYYAASALLSASWHFRFHCW